MRFYKKRLEKTLAYILFKLEVASTMTMALDLINSGKELSDCNNYDLAKIFEYYSCIKLSEEYKQYFYHYDKIKNDVTVFLCIYAKKRQHT